MAHTLVGERREGETRVRSSDGIPVFESTYHFLVKADSLSASRLSILRDTVGLPIPGQTYLLDGFAMCRASNAVRRADQPLYWDVTCEFSTEVKETQSSQNPGSDPTAWIPLYITKFERITEVVTKDASGVAIANSAGQPFENGMTRTRSIVIWDLVQFEPATVTDEQIADRNETVNDDTFKGRAAHTLLLCVQSSEIGFYYGLRCRLTHYMLKYNKDNWKHKRLDVGTVYLGTVGEEEIDQLPYLDAGDPDNDIPPGVILGGLDGSGGKVAAGDPPAVLEFDMYTPIDFSAFLRT